MLLISKYKTPALIDGIVEIGCAWRTGEPVWVRRDPNREIYQGEDE